MIFKNAELHNVESLKPFDFELLRPQTDAKRTYPLPANAEQGFLLGRVPEEVRTSLNPFAQTISYQGCGSEIRFVLKSGKAKIRLARFSCPEECFSMAEVFYGNFQGHLWYSPKVVTPGEITELVVELPQEIDLLCNIAKETGLGFDPRVVRVLLPYDLPNILFDIEGDIEPPKPEQLPKLKQYSYGSSLTHGSVSVNPSGTYAHRIAQSMNADLYNKASAGSAHLDKTAADYLAAQDWSYLTLELGINVVHHMSPEEFASRVDYFLDTVTKGHPDRWVFCTDLVYFQMDFEKNDKGDVFRAIVRDKIASMQPARIVYIPGKEIFPSWDCLSADILHPSGFGAERIAAAFVKAIRENMKD